MADAEQMRVLIAYNQWADERILSALEGVSDDGGPTSGGAPSGSGRNGPEGT